MNAVNLIPLEGRRSATVSAPGAPFLALLGALVAILGATYLYVNTRDQISARQAQLTQVQAGVGRWSAAAARFSPDIAQVAQQEKAIDNVRQLVARRYDWSLLLGQLARVTPVDAQLSTLTATGLGTPSSATGSGAAASATATLSSPGIQLGGCAASQSAVADTMVALRRIVGVAQVSLQTSGRQGAAGQSCSFPVQFTLSLVFDPPTELTTSTPTPAATATTTTAQSSSTTMGGTS